MIFNEVLSDNSSCLTRDAHEASHCTMPHAAPISPCKSEELSSASTAATDGSIAVGFGKFYHKYRVNPRILGAGYQGTVRECIDRVTGERLAVKSIEKSDPSVEPSELAREIELLREMKHRSIVRLVDVYEDDEYLHIVTDLCRGGELFDKIIEKAVGSSDSGGAPCFGEHEAARLLHQTLQAVRYMHERGIVHRDLKPENILFETKDADSPIKIIDFGMACKQFGSSREEEPPLSDVVGTPYYTAPEVLRGKYDKSCDLWSVGVIAYVLLCAYHPFNGVNKEEVHDSIRRGHYTFPMQEWSGASPEAIDFISRLLQMNPRKRMTVDEALRHPWIVKKINSEEVAIAVTTEKVVAKGARSANCKDARKESRGLIRWLLKRFLGNARQSSEL